MNAINNGMLRLKLKVLAAHARRPQKLSATPDLSGTVLPLCPITNSVSPNVRPFNSALPKVSA
ncbi:hypothetical protein, partial [Pseudomonas veronii]|uniref:hypothetical protein n=1 Tax=Pseudomonas veronii TaxID=76761 RepID=UPI001CA392B2